MKENNCIFCKIVKKEIPCNKIYEDENILVFLDIKPINPGHTLVISKEHHETLLDTPEEILKELIIKTKELTPKILKAVNSKAFNIHINNKSIAGQVIPHIHFHIIPRFENDNIKMWKGKDYKKNEAEEIVKSIKSKP